MVADYNCTLSTSCSSNNFLISKSKHANLLAMIVQDHHDPQLGTTLQKGNKEITETHRNEKYISSRKEVLKEGNANLGCMQNEAIL